MAEAAVNCSNEQCRPRLNLEKTLGVAAHKHPLGAGSTEISWSLYTLYIGIGDPVVLKMCQEMEGEYA